MEAETGRDNGVQWVKDRETGERFIIESDRAYIDEISAFYNSECGHAGKAVMRVPVAGGSTQVRECCTNCGARLGSPMKQSDRAWVDSLPQLPQEHERLYESRRSEEKYQILLKHGRRQHEERGAFTNQYREYLQSPGWFEKRDKVIKRCGNVCEGCGNAPVDHVHHMTYQHFGDEFLFELLGLCRACHDRVHADDAA